MNRSGGNGEHGPKAGRLSRQGLQACSDERLVELVLGGSEPAFELLFERHVADAVWYARELLGSWGEAEDAVRHSFAAARAYLGARAPHVEFGPWLHTIVGNHCLSMLQARAVARRETTDAVVDLDKWRRRRKPLGALLPILPGAGVRECLVAACGAGSGATAAGAPLLGGTLAKVAVVAVLAVGAGAGEAVLERSDPAGDSGSARVSVEQRAGNGGAASLAHSAPRSSRGLRQTVTGRGLERPRSFDRHRSPPAGNPPPAATPPAVAHQPGASAAPSPAALPPAAQAPAAEGPGIDAPARHPVDDVLAVVPVPEPVQSVVEQVGEAIGTEPPAAEAPPLALPEAVPKIVDDAGVTIGRPSVDVRALLSPGTGAPPP